MATRRYHQALLTSATAIVASLAPLNTATADTTGPAISVTVPDSIDLNGPGGDITLHISNPPTSDAYVQLSLSIGTGLTVTDTRSLLAPEPGRGSASAITNAMPLEW
ncbi:hypothetical protein DN069_15640 [Streptacidiphilus pinicola]|uniref:Uncharacterized protein n=1 Tax=Streptacidiphilus pinicola TaxID=2219663 RepID=A0A2X0KC79_9ACTN|nr:hypothetical protein [Streptacidiphilus pinicola]RAG84610.1 hypothetical protein DN069_15640 [Streptacidiphilus pinicola]